VVRVQKPALEAILERLGTRSSNTRPWPPSRPASPRTPPATQRAQQARRAWPETFGSAGPSGDGRCPARGPSLQRRRDAHRDRRTALPSHPQLSSLRTAMDPVARRGSPVYESGLRARSSNERSHRSPRHAVARALTHQASPASIRAQPKFDNGILIPERWPAGRPGTLSHKRTSLFMAHNQAIRRSGRWRFRWHMGNLSAIGRVIHLFSRVGFVTRSQPLSGASAFRDILRG
jgi:hypothetical protein